MRRDLVEAAARGDHDATYEFREDPARLRLYLVDVPNGLSMQTLLIAVMAPVERFEEVIDEAHPIIDSIEFHPG